MKIFDQARWHANHFRKSTQSLGLRVSAEVAPITGHVLGGSLGMTVGSSMGTLGAISGGAIGATVGGVMGKTSGKAVKTWIKEKLPENTTQIKSSHESSGAETSKHHSSGSLDQSLRGRTTTAIRVGRAGAARFIRELPSTTSEEVSDSFLGSGLDAMTDKIEKNSDTEDAPEKGMSGTLVGVMTPMANRIADFIQPRAPDEESTSDANPGDREQRLINQQEKVDSLKRQLEEERAKLADLESPSDANRLPESQQSREPGPSSEKTESGDAITAERPESGEETAETDGVETSRAKPDEAARDETPDSSGVESAAESTDGAQRPDTSPDTESDEEPAPEVSEETQRDEPEDAQPGDDEPETAHAGSGVPTAEPSQEPEEETARHSEESARPADENTGRDADDAAPDDSAPRTEPDHDATQRPEVDAPDTPPETHSDTPRQDEPTDAEQDAEQPAAEPAPAPAEGDGGTEHAAADDEAGGADSTTDYDAHEQQQMAQISGSMENEGDTGADTRAQDGPRTAEPERGGIED